MIRSKLTSKCFALPNTHVLSINAWATPRLASTQVNGDGRLTAASAQLPTGQKNPNQVPDHINTSTTSTPSSRCRTSRQALRWRPRSQSAPPLHRLGSIPHRKPWRKPLLSLRKSKALRRSSGSSGRGSEMRFLTTKLLISSRGPPATSRSTVLRQPSTYHRVLDHRTFADDVVALDPCPQSGRPT